MNITLEMMHFPGSHLSYLHLRRDSLRRCAWGRRCGRPNADDLLWRVAFCEYYGSWWRCPASTVVMVEWSYPITWTMTSLMYLIYYFHGDGCAGAFDKQSRHSGANGGARTKFLFFDLDDTLLDFHKTEAWAIRQALRRSGVGTYRRHLARHSEINQRQWELLEEESSPGSRCCSADFSCCFGS